MKNPSLIWNKAKILATIHNAKLVIGIQNECGNFDKYMWQFANNKKPKNTRNIFSELPSKSEDSEKMSEDLKK